MSFYPCLCVFYFRKSNYGHTVIHAGDTGFSRAPTVMVQKNHSTGTSSRKSFVPYVVCSVMKTDLCAVKTVSTSRNDDSSKFNQLEIMWLNQCRSNVDSTALNQRCFDMDSATSP